MDGSRPMSHGTRCDQLGMYVVYYSPMQMLCDAPTAYLRAGNATSVYVMIDDEAYGPLSSSDSVVRDIALLPTSVAGTMAEVDDPSVALQVAAEAWRSQNVALLNQ